MCLNENINENFQLTLKMTGEIDGTNALPSKYRQWIKTKPFNLFAKWPKRVRAELFCLRNVERIVTMVLSHQKQCAHVLNDNQLYRWLCASSFISHWRFFFFFFFYCSHIFLRCKFLCAILLKSFTDLVSHHSHLPF